MSARLEINALTGGYRDTNVLFDISARLAPGDVLGVFGRNGAGKSTLARLIQGGLRPAAGDIRLHGHTISALPAHARRALGLGYMPQTAMVFDDLSVHDNLALGRNRTSPDRCFDRFPRLAERLQQPAGTMSGGERKILAFVRTMIEDTQVIVLDEPSEGVQPENIAHMVACLQERAQDGAALVLCEQNLGFLSEVATWVLGLDSGTCVMDCAASDVGYDRLKNTISL